MPEQSSRLTFSKFNTTMLGSGSVIFVAVGAEAWDQTARFDMGVVIRNTRSGKSIRQAHGHVAAASMDYMSEGSPRKMSWDIDDDGEASGSGAA